MQRQAIRNLTLAVAVASLAACSTAPKPAPVVPDPMPIRSAPTNDMELSSTDLGPMLTLDNVLFDFEKASLRSEAGPILDKAAGFLKQNPGRLAIVQGHTDTTGAAPYNIMLSEARAEAVSRALMARGVSRSRVQTAGYGETRPVANNGSLEGRKRNRRVEIVFPRAKGA